MSLYCYRYDGTFGGFLTCVFESYVNKELPTSFAILSDGPTLLEEREVTTHDAHAGRVYTALAKKVSPEFQKLIERAFLTCLSEKELALYTLIRRGLIEGDRVRRDLTDPIMARVNLALAKMWTEWDHLKGFVRFSELDGALVGEIEPKNRVLPLLAPHFAARFSGETMILYDRTHNEALFYAGGQAVIRSLTDFQMAPPDETEARYRLLWKRFYDTIAIRERENPRLRMSNMPKRYWGTMTEFQQADYFRPARTPSAPPALRAQSSPAAVGAPGVPAWKPAPEKPPAHGPSAPASDP